MPNYKVGDVVIDRGDFAGRWRGDQGTIYEISPNYVKVGWHTIGGVKKNPAPISTYTLSMAEERLGYKKSKISVIIV